MSQASQDNPLLQLALVGLTGYVFSLWLKDLRQNRSGTPDPRAFPGAATCSWAAIFVAVAGALVLLGLETGGEYALGVSGQQSDITVFYLAVMAAAAFGEELVFRGFLVMTNRGRGLLLASVIGASLLFALGHPFLWNWKSPAEGEPARLLFDFSVKAWWSTGVVMAFSLWLYALRFSRLNPKHSLIPCIAAHLAKNLGVFVIKLAQGHVSGWW
jgi:membrane protease YdiL (CAAX protease family)